MDNTNKRDPKRPVENLPDEKPEKGGKAYFKPEETAEASQRVEKQTSHDTSTNSPVKRKSELLVEHESKRKRSTDCVHNEERVFENVTDNSNIQEAILTDSHSKTCEKRIICAIDCPNTLKAEAVEKDSDINEADQCTTEDINFGTTNETHSSENLTQTSENTRSISLNIRNYSRTDRYHNRDKTLLFENTKITSPSPNTSVLDQKETKGITGQQTTFSAEATLKSKLENHPETGEADSTKKFPQKHPLDLPENKDNKLRKSPRKTTNSVQEYSSNTSLQKSRDSTSANKFDIANIIKSCERTELEKDIPLREKMPLQAFPETPDRSIPRVSPRNSLRKPIYVEPEPKFVPLDDYAKDEEFIQTQKQILESFSQQRHSNLNIVGGNDTDDEDQTSELDSCPGDPAFKNEVLRAALSYLLSQDKEDKKTSKVNPQLEEYTSPNKNIPYATTDNPEDARRLAEDTEIAYQRSIQDMVEKNDNVINPLGKTPRSPDSPPPIEKRGSPNSPAEIEEYEIPEAGGVQYREYPGIAPEPTKVKKDARYQKKFYKQKPVKLPINWKINRISPDECNVDSEENQARSNDVYDKNTENRTNEKKKSQEGDPTVPPKDNENRKNKQQKSHGDSSQETSVSVQGYKVSSFMEESPTSPTNSFKSDKSNSPKERSARPPFKINSPEKLSDTKAFKSYSPKKRVELSRSESFSPYKPVNLSPSNLVSPKKYIDSSQSKSYSPNKRIESSPSKSYSSSKDIESKLASPIKDNSNPSKSEFSKRRNVPSAPYDFFDLEGLAARFKPASIPISNSESRETGVRNSNSESRRTGVQICCSESRQTGGQIASSESRQTGVHISSSESRQTGVHISSSDNGQTGVHISSSDNRQTGVHISNSESRQTSIQISKSENRPNGAQTSTSETDTTKDHISSSETSPIQGQTSNSEIISLNEDQTSNLENSQTHGAVSNSKEDSSNTLQVVNWSFVRFNYNEIIDEKTIFVRKLFNMCLDNILMEPVRLKPHFRFARRADGHGEYSVEEFLNMVLRFQKEYLPKDRRLKKLLFKFPLPIIPLKIKVMEPVDEDDDYELDGDFLKPKRKKTEE